ncbi:MAG: aminoglycoside phosphotransferase family protein [Pseudomonadota bacterium]
MSPCLLNIANEFLSAQSVATVHALGSGLINDTYLVHCAGVGARDFVLQRVNSSVFAAPQLIIDNIQKVSTHLAQQHHSGDETKTLILPTLYQTHAGNYFFVDADGGFWRAMSYIPHTYSIKVLSNVTQAEAVGFALGAFHHALLSIAPNDLHVTLPGFHITPRYLAQYDDILAHGATLPPLQEWYDCHAAVAQGRSGAGVLENAKFSGQLTERPIHGDPKLDNFLFDRTTQGVVSLIDLDTLQPGLIHYDIGDCIRSCCNTGGESPSGIDAVDFNLDYCRGILQGYFSGAQNTLTAKDIEYLYAAIRLIPWELGLRFLTDHLAGDRYFKVATRGQNLHRARVQFRLYAEIVRHRTYLLQIIASLAHTSVKAI